MDQIHNLKLIDGQFSPPDALKVISELISSKINYHSMEAFSNKERFNTDISFSEQRIAELRNTRKDLENIIKIASEKGCTLKIESFIAITLIEIH